MQFEREIKKKEHEMSKQADITPNLMQSEASRKSLISLRSNGKNKALLISATGTGKTYLAAFDVQQCETK